MKNIKLFFYCYFSILFFLFIIGVFFDFQISQMFASLEENTYYSLNSYAIIIEVFGELPFFILISCCFLVCCCYTKQIKKRILRYPVQSFLFLCASGTTFLAFLRTTKFIQSYASISVDLITFCALALTAILLCLIIFIFIKKLKQETIKKLFWFSIMIFVVSIISIFVIQIIKNNICVRARFRAIYYVNNSELFKPCWQLLTNTRPANFILPFDAYKSFPSGHTMTASIFLCFVFLPLFLNIKSNAKILCWICPILFILCVGTGRIVAGAHFLTDVVFSAILVDLLYLIFYFAVFRKKVIV